MALLGGGTSGHAVWYISADLMSCCSRHVRNNTNRKLFTSYARCETFLGAFAKLRKVIIGFVVSVHPCRTYQLPLDGYYWNSIFEYFSKICRENSSFIKLTQITDAWHESLCTFMIICLLVLMFNKVFFFENHAVHEITRKNMAEPDKPQMAIQHGACALHAA